MNMTPILMALTPDKQIAPLLAAVLQLREARRTVSPTALPAEQLIEAIQQGTHSLYVSDDAASYALVRPGVWNGGKVLWVDELVATEGNRNAVAEWVRWHARLAGCQQILTLSNHAEEIKVFQAEGMTSQAMILGASIDHWQEQILPKAPDVSRETPTVAAVPEEPPTPDEAPKPDPHVPKRRRTVKKLTQAEVKQLEEAQQESEAA